MSAKLGYLRAFASQQAVGMIAQVAAALPLLLITLLLTRTQGLERAGQFTVVAGLSAFLFSPAAWGFRTHVVLHRFERFTARDYLAARAAAVSLACAATLVSAVLFHVPLLLGVVVVLFRAGDTLLDLDLAFNQVRRENHVALNRYALRHIAKLALLLLACGLGLALHLPYGDLIVAGVGAAVCVAATLQMIPHLLQESHRPVTLASVRDLFLHSGWFGGAEVCSTALSSAPRISLPWLYSGPAMGVAGTSLSVGGFFGMVYYTTWLRFLPAYKTQPSKRRAIRNFVLESMVISLLLAAASWFILPELVALAFKYRDATDIAMSRNVLMASVAFFASSGLVNLFKITSRPWLEPLSYVCAVAIAACCAWIFPSLRHTPALLIVLGLAMLAFTLPLLLRLLMSQPASTSQRPLAVFARTSSRPIPRVSRMMRVTAELGYDCLFLGSHRDKNLPKEDSWEGWRVLRLGKPFPLLNGKGAVLYAKSLFRFNRDFYRVLRRMRPALIHASDYNTVPAALLYCAFNKARLIYNIHDNIAATYNVPSWVASIANAIEGLFVLGSDVTLVPESFRRTMLPAWCRQKVVVVRNTPVDPGFAEPPPSDGKIIIFYGGWLDWGRGLRQLTEIAAANPDIILRIAGEGSPEIVAELKGRPNVEYLGFLDHESIIEQTRRSHFVGALYDLNRVINRFAASNKIAESLAVGRPVFLNSELEITRDMAPFDCIVPVPYAQIAQSGGKLLELARDRARYLQACHNARTAYDAGYRWETARWRMGQAVLGEMSPAAIEATPATATD